MAGVKAGRIRLCQVAGMIVQWRRNDLNSTHSLTHLLLKDDREEVESFKAEDEEVITDEEENSGWRSVCD